MSLADTIIAMASAGCSVEQIAAVAQHFKDANLCDSEASDERLSLRQERNRRYYEKRLKASEKRLNASETSESVLKVSPSLSPSSSSPPITPLITTPPNSPPSKTRSASATAGDVLKILSECLTAQTATDLIAHRKALKSPLTVGSARGLVKNFQDFGDPEAAALSMMANGWRGFKSDWMKTELKIVPKERDLRSVPDNLLSADDYWKKRKQQREWA